MRLSMYVMSDILYNIEPKKYIIGVLYEIMTQLTK